MKRNWSSWLFALVFILTAGCGKKTFESQIPLEPQDDHFGENDIPADPNGEVCPRYELVVESMDQKVAHRNYRFVYDSEMKLTSTQGQIDVQFTKNSPTIRYTLCSGSTVNTSVLPTLKPLNATEELTRQLVRNVGQMCMTMVPMRQTTLSVIDVASGRVLFSELKFRQDMGCEFGYTSVGQNLRQQLIQFADTVVDLKASQCYR